MTDSMASRKSALARSTALVPSWTPVRVGTLPLDTQSFPARLDALRWKQNLETTVTGELRSRSGFIPLFYNVYSQTEYARRNVDLRSQGNVPRGRLTCLMHAISSSGTHYLFAAASPFQSGTTIANAAWLLNASNHTWTTIQLPGSGYQWPTKTAPPQVALHKDRIIYTNNESPPFAIRLVDGVTEEIPSLVTDQYGLDPVSRARVVLAHKGMVILMNLRMGGADVPTRILWSDINRLYFGLQDLDDIAPVTGWQDLEYSDPILAAAELQDTIIIYTQNAIWTMRFAPGPNSVWAWRKVYHDPVSRRGLLYYPHSLVSDGRFHYYIGRDGIYRYSPYYSEPERVMPATLAAGMLFHPESKIRIDPTQPDLVIGGRIANTDEIWWSWKPAAEPHQKWTFAYNTALQTADYIDHGFSALASFVRYGLTETIPIGVSAVDNTIKHLNASQARYLYRVQKPSDPIDLLPQASQEGGPSNMPPAETPVYPVAHAYSVFLRGFVPGLTLMGRTRILSVRVDVGRLIGDPVGIGFRFASATRIPELIPERFTPGQAGPDLTWVNGNILHAHTSMSLDSLLEAPQQLEGVYLIYELSIGHPEKTHALLNSQVSLGTVWFETIAVGYAPY